MADSRCVSSFSLAAIIVLTTINLVNSKVASGIIVSQHTNWQFITRFCFLSKAGKLQFEFLYPQKYDLGYNKAQNILLYSDIQWPSVYPRPTYSQKERKARQSMSCLDREAKLNPDFNQVINLTTRYKWSGCKLEEIHGEKYYRCKGGRTFTSSRERWWYIAVSNCGSDQGIYLNYTITMTNSLFGNPFFRHFSADEFYILHETIGFLIAYMFLLILSLYVAYSLSIRQLYHTTYKLYMASMCLEFLALVAQIIYWAEYARTGRPIISWKNLGRFLEFSGQALFLILLILMGKGYTITRGRISSGGVIKIIVFSIAFVGATIAMVIWEISAFDPALVLYIYDSIPGYGLIGIKIASWLWFLYGIFFTLKHYPEKLVFYLPFLIIYTIWFWFGAAVALAAINAIPKYMREKVVQGCTLAAIFLGHLVFLILTWPTMANKTFPYHIKTTQVGTMEISSDAPSAYAAGNGDAGGAYSPSTNNQSDAYEPIGEKKFIDMFTTSQSKSSAPMQMVNPDKFPHDDRANGIS